MCKALIGAGARVDAVNRKRLTAAHFAAKAGHIEVLQVLTAHGAAMDQPDSLGWLGWNFP